MAKFLNTVTLNAELYNLIKNAESKIILISPFIKLHPTIHTILETKKGRHDVSITIVFGKNKGNLSQSLGKDDLDFFREFPNVEIRYSEMLHAKYYASESAAILTSMNLYDYSQNNNIEFGILLKPNLLTDIAVAIASDGSLDLQAYTYFREEVIPHSKLLFRKEPRYDKGFVGSGYGKKFLESVVTDNELDVFFSNSTSEQRSIKPVSQPSNKHLSEPASAVPTGYCIRTGAEIPFNPKRPLSDEAYKNWSKFSNSDYAEKYCHFSGEPSNGETSFAKPIMKKNWNKAKAVHGI